VYFETSALQNEGHRELFEYVAEAALKKKIAGQQSKLSSDIRCFLSKSELADRGMRAVPVGAALNGTAHRGCRKKNRQVEVQERRHDRVLHTPAQVDMR
jgi:hypothetical protein